MDSKKICIDKKTLFLILFLVISVSAYLYSINIIFVTKTTYKSKAEEPKIETKKPNQIFGGTVVADPKKWPFVIALFLIEDNTVSPYTNFHCTGSLIAPTWVLTAGHCMTKGNYKEYDDPLLETKNIAIYAGGVDLDHWESKNIFYVKNIIRHEEYGIPTYVDNDIALIELFKPVPILDADIPKTVSLNDNKYIEGTKIKDQYNKGVVLGFGYESLSGFKSISHHLNQGIVPLLPYSAKFNRLEINLSLTEKTELPVGYPLGGVNACYGDSGGPFIVWDDSKSKWVQVGVASWLIDLNNGDCNGDSIYTKVSAYIDWIEKIIKGKNGKNEDYIYQPNNGTFTGSGKELTEDDLREFECRINNKGIPLNGATYKCGNELEEKKIPTVIPPGVMQAE